MKPYVRLRERGNIALLPLDEGIKRATTDRNRRDGKDGVSLRIMDGERRAILHDKKVLLIPYLANIGESS